MRPLYTARERVQDDGVKRRPTTRDWLPLAKPRSAAAEVPTGEAFRPAWIDFEHGIRVGNLQPHERITQILKHRLEETYTTPFVTDRWGRGVFWQWICWVPRENREAKPLSSSVNFGCAKYSITIDKTRKVFQFGLSVERGIQRGKPPFPGILLKKDWDWHRLMALCVKGSALDRELQRLVREEGFTAAVVGAAPATFTSESFTSAAQVRAAAARAPAGSWAGFDLFYPMPEEEVKGASGWEIVQAITSGFAALAPVLNMCMQVPLTPRGRESATPSGTTKEPRRQP
jgi:hypothetical protein